MEINRLAFGVVAAACITAAGGGAYLATRHSAAEQPAPVASSAPADTPGSALAGTEASEGVVAPSPAAAEPQSASTAATPPPSPVESPRATRQAPRPSSAGSPQMTRRNNARDAARDSGRPLRQSDSRDRTADLPDRTASAAPIDTPPAAPVYTPPPPAPPEPQFQDLVVSADQVIGLQVDTPLITSERARIEDKVDARVTRDVKVGDRVAIPAGAKALGSVTLVDRGGKMRDRARLGIRFHTIVLADGSRVPIQTDAVFREGDAPGGESAAKIGGGAIGGAIIGGILGGARGAILGGSAGAGAGTAAVMAGGRNPATLRAGETVTVRLMGPVTVTVEK